MRLTRLVNWSFIVMAMSSSVFAVKALAAEPRDAFCSYGTVSVAKVDNREVCWGLKDENDPDTAYVRFAGNKLNASMVDATLELQPGPVFELKFSANISDKLNAPASDYVLTCQKPEKQLDAVMAFQCELTDGKDSVAFRMIDAEKRADYPAFNGGVPILIAFPDADAMPGSGVLSKDLKQLLINQRGWSVLKYNPNPEPKPRCICSVFENDAFKVVVEWGGKNVPRVARFTKHPAYPNN